MALQTLLWYLMVVNHGGPGSEREGVQIAPEALSLPIEPEVRRVESAHWACLLDFFPSVERMSRCCERGYL